MTSDTLQPGTLVTHADRPEFGRGIVAQVFNRHFGKVYQVQWQSYAPAFTQSFNHPRHELALLGERQ